MISPSVTKDTIVYHYIPYVAEDIGGVKQDVFWKIPL